MEGEWSMPNETEKLTVNLGIVELAQIDVLVEQGIFSNRSDFIRNAVRIKLEDYKDKIEQQLLPLSSNKFWRYTIGIQKITKKDIENLVNDKQKINISVIGMLIIDKAIDAELFEKTVEHVIIRGKLLAEKNIKEIIEKMN